MNELLWRLPESGFDEDDYNLYTGMEGGPKNATRLYMLVLYGLIRSNGWKHLVELGSFQGNTTALFARAAAKVGGMVHAYEVDGWRAAQLRDRFHGSSHVVIHEAHSQRAAPLKEPPDFVFVDGDHTVEGCMADIRCWAPQVVLGGCMAFHDAADPLVQQAVAETLPASFSERILFPGDCGLLLARRVM